MKTSVEPLDGTRVKLHVEIPAAEFERAVDSAFRKLASKVKLPGFRPGKAPRPLLEARLGPGVAREQALRDSLPEYYAEAVVTEGVDPIAAPEIEITAGADDGDVAFDAVVEVRPKIELDGYEALRVVLEDPTVPDEDVRAQVDRLRDQFADLEDSPRPLQDGDFAQIDLKGYVHDELVEGLSASDFLYEVGSGQLVGKLDDELRGKRPGDILKFVDALPEWFGDRAGQEVGFQVLVKAAKRKVLPELTDEWVQDASEFSTVAELEADIRRRLEIVSKVQAQVALRDKLLDALADLVTIEAPRPLVQEETQRRVHDVLHRLEARGATLDQYLQSAGLSQEQFVARVQEGAERAVKADLALRAIVEQEGIEVTDEDLDREVERLAERVGRQPHQVRAELERGGGFEAVRSDVARGKALQYLVDHAVVVDEAGNQLDLALPEAPEGGVPEADNEKEPDET